MDFLKEKWYIVTCNAGESCWCRIITTDVNKNDMKHCVIHSGAVSKEIAEHIVNLHNKSLEEEK